MDLVSTLLAHKLRYHPGERDMVILSHEIVTQPYAADVVSASMAGSPMQREVHTSSLVLYGEVGGNSAMSRTVGLPLAAATLRILDGEVRARGVMAPVENEIYRPVLEDLVRQGMVLKETVSSGRGMGLALLHN
jgi:alpha-aminoadipic semialdehyde synthase